MASSASVFECLTLSLALDPGHLTLSLDELIDLPTFGLKTVVVHGLLSFHHFENLGHPLRQQFEQQQ